MVPEPPSVQGVYEVCIGVSDPIVQLQYWEQFGYRIGAMGELSAVEAEALYGVRSAVRSIRLYHQTADHGLVRLMQWQTPVNAGLEMASMKTKGNRWATTLTADVLAVLNQAEEAAAAGLPIRYSSLHWEVIYNKERHMRPFVDPAIGVRELLLLQPLTRQVLFERFHYSMPNYGAIAPTSPFQTSQITHMGLVIQDDRKQTLTFYEQVLGLVRSRDDVETSYESSSAGRELFDLKPGERFFVTSFDDPRSPVADWQQVRSGRLYIIRFPETMTVPERFAQARPGCLGMSLYTYRVQGLEQLHDRVQASEALQVTAMVPNEFNEPSFSFTAPDGYRWALVASPGSFS
ncbi:VOC family protein [Oculatella sp. LEGE 06141]|uniref:VOC family protein n=1 Tax=Oculatella sp. LEGE 06141 TaxID=1828648 RepID=UPI00187F712B|nr:VOC family protein [Oculatella sp. LEGE 06141]MBE9179147.1 VOC family protein [Oculatella sp. LEGE 06141]